MKTLLLAFVLAVAAHAQSVPPSIIANNKGIVLSVVVASPTPTTYQWFVNNRPVQGANQPSYTVPVNAGFSLVYVVVKNSGGTTQSIPVQISDNGSIVTIIYRKK